MRTIVLMALFACVLLAGCTDSITDPDSASSTRTVDETVVVPPEWPPEDDPAVAREDAAGKTPEQVVLALIEATVKGDWETVYSLYTNQTVDYETYLDEWTSSDMAYSEFHVLETRVSGERPAAVRVTYTMVGPLGEDLVKVEEPGQWWAVWKVDGLWKVQWMPVQ